MARSRNVALFLSTIAVASVTMACGHSPEEGDKEADKEKPALQRSSDQAPAQDQRDQGDEGGEGGEG